MSKDIVMQIVTTTGVGFLATVDNNQPRVRPMVINTIWNNKLYSSCYENSQKVKQIKKNPHCEIVWVDKNMRQVRMRTTITICDDKNLKKKYFDSMSGLSNYFSGADDPNYSLLEIVPNSVAWMDTNARSYQEVDW